MDYSVSIVCGGKSRRMGQDKKSICWHGKTLLDRILHGFPGCDDLFLSINDETTGVPAGIRAVKDIYPGCGPLSGLHASLLCMRSELLFAVSCDAPLIDQRTVQQLEPLLGGHMAVVPRTSDGRIHPLAGLYRRELGEIADQQLRCGNYRVQDFLKQIDAVYLPGAVLPYGELTLSNLNTPEDILHLEEKLKLNRFEGQ